MKLSQMNSEQAYDKVCDLVVHIDDIAKDKEMKNIIDKLTSYKEGENQIRFGVELIAKVTKVILKKEYKENVFGIISVMNEKAIEEIKNQPLVITIKEIKELIQDTDLMQLFLSQVD